MKVWKQRTLGLIAVIGAVVVVVAGSIWNDYSYLQQQDSSTDGFVTQTSPEEELTQLLCELKVDE
jgi:thiol:disulfide interchange protein